MDRMKKIISSGLIVALIAMFSPMVSLKAYAAQSCALNSYYGTVDVNGVPMDNISVTLTDLTNGAPALSGITTAGGMYLIESANLSTCALIGDQIQISASYNGFTATSTVLYAVQPITQVNLSISLPVVTSILLTPSNSSVFVGVTQQYSAVALDQNSVVLATQPTFTWSSSNPAIASIDSNGLATGVSVGGPVVITATSGVVSGTAGLSVALNTPPAVNAIPAQSVNVGTNLTFTVSATDVDGDSLSYSLDANAPTGAVIDATTGVFMWTPSTVGTFNFNVNVSDGINPAVSAPVTVTVNPFVPLLTSIVVSPATSSLTIGKTQQFTAVAFDQNGTAMVTQPTFTWTSSDTTLAIVDANGLVSGVAVGGPINITATSDTVTGTAQFTVSTPLSVSISPAISVAKIGQNITFTPVVSGGATTVSSFTWNYGDGSAVTTGQGVPLPSQHIYSTAGVYVVTLTIVDSANNTLTATAKAVTNLTLCREDDGFEFEFESMDDGAYEFKEVKESTPEGSIEGYSGTGEYHKVTSTAANGSFLVNLHFSYKDTDNNGTVDGTSLNENHLEVYYWNGTAWTKVPNPVRDSTNNKVSVKVNHFTQYALLVPTSSTNIVPPTTGGGGGGGGGGGAVRSSKKTTKTSTSTSKVTLQSVEVSEPFDDISGHWAEQYIDDLRIQGVIDGVAPGMFEPNKALTRAEMIKMTVGLYKIALPSSVGEKPFSDISISEWYAPYIMAAKNAGITDGYLDGTFRPNQIITRAETLKILLDASNKNLNTAATTSFSDVKTDAWYANYVNYASENSIVDGYSDGTFKPENEITRAEYAKLANTITK